MQPDDDDPSAAVRLEGKLVRREDADGLVRVGLAVPCDGGYVLTLAGRAYFEVSPAPGDPHADDADVDGSEDLDTRDTGPGL